jgi:CubicO group peptidase (beta-lactamase class C family)
MSRHSFAKENQLRSDGLMRALPSARNVDARAVEGFLDDVEAAGLELHSLMLWRGGVVVAEGWKWPYGPERQRIMHSLTKSVAACAIGLLIDEGRLALNQPLTDFFPEIAPDADPRLRRMTVEDLLTMRAGHDVEVSGSIWRGIETSWVAEFLRIPIVHEPGTTFVYSSAASYMVSAIVTRITGETIHDYLKPRFFAPLGITGERWDIGPDGFNPGGNGITFTTADALKLGILHVQNGLWEGRRILPARWIAQATRAQGAPDYGYHWVVGDGYYAALGVFVQMLAVYPAANSVIMLTGAMKESAVLLPHLKKHFPAAFNGPTDDTADARLAARLAAWQTVPAYDSEAPGDAADIAGSRWIVDPNPLGITALAFEPAPDGIKLTIDDDEGSHAIVAGWNGWVEGASEMPGAMLHHGYRLRGTPVIAGARWAKPRELEMVWHFAESAFRDTLTFRFAEDHLTLDRTVNINTGARAWPSLTARRA